MMKYSWWFYDNLRIVENDVMLIVKSNLCSLTIKELFQMTEPSKFPAIINESSSKRLRFASLIEPTKDQNNKGD
jgi:hypothetical protein